MKKLKLRVKMKQIKSLVKSALLLTLMLSIMVPSFAQKVKNHRFTFFYKQLPMVKLDRRIETYSSKVILGYQDEVNQLQSNYNMEVKQAEKLHADDMRIYEQQYKLAQNRYNKELAEYNRQSTIKKLAGKELLGEDKPIFSPPEKPVYIAPVAPLIPKTYNTKTLEDKYVILEGYKKGNSNPVIITYKVGLLETKPVTSTVKTRNVKKGDATVKENYNVYSVRYKQPVTLVVESSLNGIKYNRVAPRTAKFYTKTWKNTLPDNYLEQVENLALDASMKATKILLNNQFGIMKKSLAAVIYYGEGKKFNYQDYQKAMESALSGYNNLYLDDESGTKKLLSAIEIWTAALREFNPDKKKTRVGRKLGVGTMINIGAAALFAHQYDKSEEYFTKAELNNPTNDQKREINFYKNMSRSLRERYLANTQ